MAKKSATFIFDKNKKSEENVDKSLEMKATFTQRLFAFIVDAIILGFISTLIISFIPINDASKRLYEQQEEVIKDYTDKKITMDKYVNEMLDINYDISRQTYILSIVSIALSLCYYVIYPCYNNGQTLGKKLFKIREITNKNLALKDDPDKISPTTAFFISLLTFFIICIFVLILFFIGYLISRKLV